MAPPAAPLPVGMTGPDAATAWDARVDRALAGSPRLRKGMDWLREPERRWVRLPIGVLLILGGILSILPGLGVWMLPLGLALLSEDIPPLKGRLEAIALWTEHRWQALKRWRGR